MDDDADGPGPASKRQAGSSEGASLVAYAGVGGALACCAVIELLGGAVILGGLATVLGLSTGLTYLAIAGLGGLVAAGAALGYRRANQDVSD